MIKRLMIIALALLLGLTAGCLNTKTTAELQGFKARAELEKQNLELVKRYIELINQGDFKSLKEYLAPDYGIYSPSGYPEPTSREKLIENYEAAAQAIDSFAWKTEEFIAAGDKVICRIMISGIYTGNIPGLLETGKQFTFSMITIIRVENGKIVEEWMEDDQLGLTRQLGMELRPKEE